MKNQKFDVLICGAGIGGISTAFHLAVQNGISRVLLVDERPPLSLTSDKSTECYRNWWPGPDDSMVRLMTRSIDILEELAGKSKNVFGLNRRGYVFTTADSTQAERYARAGDRAAALGAGPLRVFSNVRDGEAYQPTATEGYHHQPVGADLLLDTHLIQQVFPFLYPNTIAALHIRRAGWLSAQQLGMYMLQQAQQAGVQLIRDRVESVDVQGGIIRGVFLRSQGYVAAPVFVNAAGPFLKPVGTMIGIDLPVACELHLKVSFRDHLGVLSRQAPLMIWSDPQYLSWPSVDRNGLASDPDARWLLEEFPSGVHTRPEGGGDSQIILLLWEYNSRNVEPEFPTPLDPAYPEITLRGLSAMIPGLEVYFNRLPKPSLDGGYYTKTEENRPLACPLPVSGSYVIGALSGFGIMSAPALGELLADCIAAKTLPSYAHAFDLNRYDDRAYQAKLANWGDTWQL
jgi:glycine/D-amino acid oxidase-like deaminating enzyme